MVANAAFQVGLALDLAADRAGWRETVEFEIVHADLYRAARDGLAAELHWPRELGGPAEASRVVDFLPSLLARARSGLEGAGVEASEAEQMLAVIDRRARSGQTGAVWQRAALSRAERTRPAGEAIRSMFEAYLERSREGEPVDRWGLPE